MAVSAIAAYAQSNDLERAVQRIDTLPARTLLSAPINRLVDPQRQHLAEAVIGRRPPLFFGSALLEMAALLWMWRSGKAAALRDALRRAVRNVHVLRLFYVWTLAMIAQIASLPAEIVSYRLSVTAGLSMQSPAEWFGQAASTAIANAIMAAVLFAFMLWLSERTRLWYLVGAVFLVGFVLLAALAQPVVLAPWLRHQQPLGDSVLARRLYAYERKSGVSVPITIEATGSGAAAAESRISGLGPTQQIVISDALLAAATPGELEFVVARESAHVRANDMLKLDLYAAALLIVAAAVAVTLADRVGFRRDDDPLSRLALLGVFLGLSILALLPVANAYSRRLEARADHAGLRITGDPAAAVRQMVRLADVDLLVVCPPPIVRRYFLTYPPVGSRIAAVRGGGDPCP